MQPMAQAVFFAALLAAVALATVAAAALLAPSAGEWYAGRRWLR